MKIAMRLPIRGALVLLGGLSAEAALFVIAIALYLVPHGSEVLLYVVPPACLVITVFSGYRVARAARTMLILHGVLVGCTAALIYIVLTWGKTLPAVYIVSHFLKVIGGALGGIIAYKQAAGRARQLSNA